MSWTRDWHDLVVAAIRLGLHVKSGSRRPWVGGSHPGPRGPALVVAVRERAVDGRATQAALRAVAGALQVPRAAVTLVSGAGSREKLIDICTTSSMEERELWRRISDLYARSCPVR